jgi:hypothetical protein
VPPPITAPGAFDVGARVQQRVEDLHVVGARRPVQRRLGVPPGGPGVHVSARMHERGGHGRAVRVVARPVGQHMQQGACGFAGVQASWVTADEVYGADPDLRTELETRGIGYVLAIGCDRRVRINHGRTVIRADTLAARIPAHAWQTRSCGPGAKGPRIYQWAWITTATRPGEHRWLLIRRNPHTSELAFYLCWSPRPVPLHTLVRVAGSRWSIEELFQTGKNEIGLDHYQVQTWTSWHRFITLAMLALALLTILSPTPDTEPDLDSDIIAITAAETRRLLNALITNRPIDANEVLRWSLWRRKVQARARRAHYQRRLTRDG